MAVVVLAVLSLVAAAAQCAGASPPSAAVKGRAVNDSNDLPGWCGIGPAGPGPDGMDWSGTVAYCIGKWAGGTGDPIRKVELWVNGLRRYRREWTSDYPLVYPDALPCDTAWKWVIFSTTQFANNSTLTLDARVWTRDGQYDQAIDTQHTAWNRAWVGVCPQNEYWVTRAGYALSFFLGANHGAAAVWTTKPAGAILGMIPLYSCFHFTGHGTGYGFHDCLFRAGDDYSDEHAVEQVSSDPEISNAVALKDGEYPAYNFVFLDTCLSAVNATLKNAFGTKSFIGWTGTMDGTPPYQTFVETFYSGLAYEGTVGSSAIEAYNASGLSHFAVWGGTYYVHRTYDPV